MNDTQLAESMRALPRTKASPSFTSDVVRAVRQAKAAPRPARVTWRAAAAFAMAACLVLIVHAAFLRHTREQQLNAIRAEQARIERELDAVKRTATTEPVVVLENEDGTRVLVELMDRDDAAPTPTKVIY